MKTFEQLTIKQVKKEIIAWETEMGREPKIVEVLSIGQHSTALDVDANIYTDGDGDTMEYFSARVIIDGEERIRYYVWDCDDEDIYTGVDEDPQANQENPQGPAAMILALMENNFLQTRDQSLCLINNIPSDMLEEFYNDLNKLYSVLCDSSESERNFKLKAFISIQQLALKFKASYIKKMMREMFNIPQPKVEELSSRIPDKDVDLLIRHMNMWKENIIEPGCLRDEDIPEYIYERICRFLEGERPIVRLAKGKIVKLSEGEYRYEEQKQ